MNFRLSRPTTITEALGPLTQAWNDLIHVIEGDQTKIAAAEERIDAANDRAAAQTARIETEREAAVMTESAIINAANAEMAEAAPIIAKLGDMLGKDMDSLKLPEPDAPAEGPAE